MDRLTDRVIPMYPTKTLFAESIIRLYQREFVTWGNINESSILVNVQIYHTLHCIVEYF